MSKTIGDALAEAAAHLKGQKLSKEALEIADRAFARFGRRRPSDDAAECASELMKLMAS
jgi:hypothetical protein